MYLGYASAQFMKHCYVFYVKHPVLNKGDNKMSKYSLTLKSNIL